MQPREVDVCIVGGGVAGLAAACAFRKAGRSVLVLERREQTLSGDPHRGDLLAFGVPAILAGWGIDLELRDAQRLRRSRVDPESGRPIDVEFGGSVEAFALPHSQVEEALLDAALSLGAEVFMGWQLQATYLDDSARLRRLTAVSLRDGVEVRAKLVVGADGRSSKVRQAMDLKRHTSIEPAHDVVAFEATLAEGPSARMNDAWVVHVGPAGGSFQVPVGPERVRVLVPVKRGDGTLLVAMEGRELAAAVANRTSLPAGATVDGQRCRNYELTDGFHYANYVSKGAVVIGDAAHVAAPPAPVGMRMAIEDAAALGTLVGPALAEGDRGLDKALSKYELVRWQANEKLLAAGTAFVEWLGPLPTMKAALLKTPLAKASTRVLHDLS